MRKPKKLDILKRLPNGSVLDVTEDSDSFSVDLNGHNIFYAWKDSTNTTWLSSLEILIKSLALVYERAELAMEEAKK